MNSPSNTSSNIDASQRASSTSPSPGSANQGNQNNLNDDSGHSPSADEQLEDMDLDETHDSDTPVFRHFEDASKSSDEKLLSEKGKLAQYENTCDQLTVEYNALLVSPSIEKEDERIRVNTRISDLTMRIKCLKEVIVAQQESISSLEDTKFKLFAREKQLNAVNETVSEKTSYLRIQEKDLPVFDVVPLYERKLAKNDGVDSAENFLDLRNGEKSLNNFLTKFERVFQYRNVNINKYWSFHLETCLQNNAEAMKWYNDFIKIPLQVHKKNFTWEQAKKLLRNRFDIAENASFMYCNEYLSKIKQWENESILAYVSRFGSHLAAAQINTGDCFYFIVYFLNTLSKKGFKDKVLQVLKDDYYHTMIHKQGLGTTEDSKYADNVQKYIPKSFLEFSVIINKHFRELDAFVLEQNKDLQSKTSSSSPSTSKNNKKRKMEAENMAEKTTDKSSGDVNQISDLLSLLDLNKPLSKAQRQLFINAGLCSFCRVAKFTAEHKDSCDVRKKWSDSKKVNNNPSKPQNPVDESVQNTDSNVFYSRVNNNDALPLDVPSDTESESSLTEYQLCYINQDVDIMRGTYDDDNKKVYSISKYNTSGDKKVLSSSLNSKPRKRNTVGDVNNPFETSNEAFAPVSCITINDVNTYCLIDTGAEVSLISKDFAEKNNIKYQIIPGFLCVADGKRIPRQQTTEFLSVEYDGVMKPIPHKFDIIDNEQLVKEGKIIVGYDLLPKLNIYLTNVAYKFKSTTKVDDAIEDKPYEPNVTPYGSDREQKAFSMALKPYIEANKNLKPNSLCNLPESVLYLPTPEGYYANVKQYAIAYSDQPKVMAIINEWLEAGIIMEAEPSEWNLPITVSPKKDLDGKKTELIRVVLDTRLLNKELPIINETLPLIADIYHAIGHSKVFTTIDLKSAFSQFPVNPADRKKTSFTAPNGLKYMHVGSPFGVSTISQLFSRVMLTLFKDLPYIRVFVDDICIFSQSMEAHFLHVKEVIKILTQANLRINFDKSHFAKAEVFLLGFSISEHGRRIDQRKLTNIMDWPRPTNAKQCAAFLGFVNYFRQHLPNVAELTAKMDSLRSFEAMKKKSDVPFKWTDAHEHDFRALKEILSSDITLSHPNHSHPFCIGTDASNFAIGCCLYQEYKVSTANNDNKVVYKYIGFFSRKLSKSEQNYSTTMRELLAIIYALKQFHKFIWGVHFTVFSDHKAISFAHSQKNANSMIIKWLDIFLDYDFSVVYRKGTDNILPDSLSRLFEPDNYDSGNVDKVARNKRILITNMNHGISETINEKKHKSMVETESKNILCVAKAKNNDIVSQANTHYYDIELNDAIKKSILDTRQIFYVQSTQTIYSDYVLPPDESEKNSLLDDAHHKVGHYGAEQMVKRIHQQGIHWPNLIQSCVHYVRKCTECQKNNIEKRGYHPARNLYSYVPGDHFAIDLGGPISTSETHNYNYFLVLICVCTRFCILRPLTDKKSDTVLRALVDIFSIFGPPLVLSSDNGKEFSNTLSTDLANALGYDHRFITPMHASANGISERLVQEVKRSLAKNTHGVGQDWSLKLNAIQLALNNRISKRLNSTPFSLMFARKMIDPYGFKADLAKLATPANRKPMSHEELMKRIDYMTDIVFPAINAKTDAQVELEEAKFNAKHRLVEYKEGDHVMVRVQTKLGQLAPSYEGPYTVVRKNQGNSYILRDETGVLAPRNYTSIELKLISKDEVIDCDDEGNEIKHFEVEAIVNHRGDHRKREYLVRWKNYSPEYDEWVAAKDMNATALLRDYWKKLGIACKPPKGSKNIQSPTSSKTLKNNPPGSISNFIDSLDADPFEDKSSSVPATTSTNSRSKKRSSVNHGSNSSTKRTRMSTRNSKQRA